MAKLRVGKQRLLVSTVFLATYGVSWRPCVRWDGRRVLARTILGFGVPWIYWQLNVRIKNQTSTIALAFHDPGSKFSRLEAFSAWDLINLQSTDIICHGKKIRRWRNLNIQVELGCMVHHNSNAMSMYPLYKPIMVRFQQPGMALAFAEPPPRDEMMPPRVRLMGKQQIQPLQWASYLWIEYI